jgi:hypothetical protein
MNPPEYFHMAINHASYRPLGQVSLQEIISLIGTAITYSCEQQIRRLFIDTRQVTGINSLTIFERYTFSEGLALCASSYIKVVLVIKPYLIHPERFGITVARNRGLNINVMASESEALDWLLDPHTD